MSQITLPITFDRDALLAALGLTSGTPVSSTVPAAPPAPAPDHTPAPAPVSSLDAPVPAMVPAGWPIVQTTLGFVSGTRLRPPNVGGTGVWRVRFITPSSLTAAARIHRMQITDFQTGAMQVHGVLIRDHDAHVVREFTGVTTTLTEWFTVGGSGTSWQDALEPNTPYSLLVWYPNTDGTGFVLDLML